MITDRKKAEPKQSGIRARTKLCTEIGGINLGQGVCDLPIDQGIKDAAALAINNDYNMYSPHEGLPELKQAIINKLKIYNNLHVTANEVLVTSGATGAFVSALKAMTRSGDEAIIFEPYYGYHKQLLELHNINIRTVMLGLEGNYPFSISDLSSQINARTKIIILCNPSNPSGKVFTKNELIEIAELAKKNNIHLITDEIYEHIVYSPYQHISVASFSEYFNHVITISGLSKTYHMTGWRLGYAIGPAEVIKRMGLIHDLLYICAPTPLQMAGIQALQFPPIYYKQLQKTFTDNRNYLVDGLRNLGFEVQSPQGAYYLIADYRKLVFTSNTELFADILLYNTGVSTVPGKYFYTHSSDADFKIRFCFALANTHIIKALQQMQQYFKNRDT